MGHLLARQGLAVTLAVIVAALLCLLIVSPVEAQDLGEDPAVQTLAPVVPPSPTAPGEPAPTVPAVIMPQEPVTPQSPVPVVPPAPVEAPIEEVAQPAPSVDLPPVQLPPVEVPVEEAPQLPETPVEIAVEPVPALETVPASSVSQLPTPEPAADTIPTQALTVESDVDQKEVFQRTGKKEAIAKETTPEGSPLGVQLAAIAVLLVLGAGYFRLMSHSGRPARPVINSAENGKQPDGA